LTVLSGVVTHGKTPALLISLTPGDQEKLAAGRQLAIDGTPAGLPRARGYITAGPTQTDILRSIAGPIAPGALAAGGLRGDSDAPLRIRYQTPSQQLRLIIGMSTFNLAQLAAGEHFIIDAAPIGLPATTVILAALKGEQPSSEEISVMVAAYPLDNARRHRHRPRELIARRLHLLDIIVGTAIAGYAITGRDNIPLSVRTLAAGTGFGCCP
jgi:hypothetical protein